MGIKVIRGSNRVPRSQGWTDRNINRVCTDEIRSTDQRQGWNHGCRVRWLLSRGWEERGDESRWKVKVQDRSRSRSGSWQIAGLGRQTGAWADSGGAACTNSWLGSRNRHKFFAISHWHTYKVSGDRQWWLLSLQWWCHVAQMRALHSFLCLVRLRTCGPCFSDTTLIHLCAHTKFALIIL